MSDNNKVQIIVQCKDYKNNYNDVATLGTIKHKLPMIDSYVVEIYKDELLQLQNEEGILSFELDTHITAQMNRAADIIQLKWAHDRNIYGQGIGVAVVDTGLSLHRDFVERGNRVVGFHDLLHGRTEPYDDNGHGSHVAGIIGGDGYLSGGRYIGVAPKCNLIGVKVLDQRGDGNISDVLVGLQWILDNKDIYNIRIANISVGTTTKNIADENSLLVSAVDALWDAGVVVVVAAGYNGPVPMSISTPGISRNVITVGSSDDKITVEMFGSKRTDYSGRGPTVSCIKKPDIVAPGSNIVSCNTMKNYQRYRYNMLNYPRKDHMGLMYTTKSGTSMATPIVSGAIALLLSQHPTMTNKEVKLRLRNCAIDIGFPWNKQGWGLLNIPLLLEDGC